MTVTVNVMVANPVCGRSMVSSVIEIVSVYMPQLAR